MDPYYIISIFFGIFSKLFDDIIDNPLFRSIFGSYAELVEEVFKAGMYSFSGILIYHTPIFGLFFTILSVTMIFGDKYVYNDIGTEHKAMDNKAWYAYFIITLFLTILLFLLFPQDNIDYLFFILITLFICIFCFIIEPYIIPENHSLKKSIFRIFSILFIILLLNNKVILSYYAPMNIDYLFYFFIFVLSYFSISIIINNLYPYNPIPVINKDF